MTLRCCIELAHSADAACDSPPAAMRHMDVLIPGLPCGQPSRDGRTEMWSLERTRRCRRPKPSHSIPEVPHDPGSGSLAPSIGDAADLCLLDVPWDTALENLDARHVALTLCGGEVIYAAASSATDASSCSSPFSPG